MRYAWWGLAVIAGLYGLHRLALWAERRGWIYYTKKSGSTGALGSAFLEMQTIFEPSKRYVLEERKKDDSEAREAGDLPKPEVNGDIHQEDASDRPRPSSQRVRGPRS